MILTECIFRSKLSISLRFLDIRRPRMDEWTKLNQTTLTLVKERRNAKKAKFKFDIE